MRKKNSGNIDFGTNSQNLQDEYLDVYDRNFSQI